MSSGGVVPPELAARKPALRRWLRSRRASTSPQDRARWSALANGHVIDSSVFDSVGILAAYAAIADEADPSRVVRWHRSRGGAVAFPRVAGARLQWHLAPPEALRPAPPWSIPEPDPAAHPPVSPADIDGWLVPGLGFTPRGDRLGYGKAFYDHALAEARTGPVVGFAFSLQVVDRLPVEPHDRPVSAIVTESGFWPTPNDHPVGF